MEHVIDPGMLPMLPVGPLGSGARILHGLLHDFPGVSLMLATLEPGEGPRMHRHPYDEALVVGEGRASFVIEGETREAGNGQVVLVPAGAQHAFTNVGTGVLRMTAIHVAPRVEIEWLETPWSGEE